MQNASLGQQSTPCANSCVDSCVSPCVDSCVSPCVSVIMPVHNASAYIEEAVQSVLQQDMGSLELICVDDASSDGSRTKLRNLAAHDERIRVIELSENVGAAQARNIALKHACGDYIAFLDSDDSWDNTKLSQQLAALKKSGCAICTCSYAMSFEDASKPQCIFHVPERISYNDMLRVNYFSCSTLMLQRDLVPSPMFNPELPHEDYGAWLELLSSGQVACGVDEALATYRVHKGSRSNNKLRAAQGRWQVLAQCTNESLPRRIALFMQYAFSGVIKYAPQRRTPKK